MKYVFFFAAFLMTVAFVLALVKLPNPQLQGFAAGVVWQYAWMGLIKLWSNHE